MIFLVFVMYKFTVDRVEYLQLQSSIELGPKPCVGAFTKHFASAVIMTKEMEHGMN